jgi:hypothetical protein
MADVAIDNAIKELKRRRDEIDNIIQGLQRLTPSTVVTAHSAPASKKGSAKKKGASKGKPMSEEIKARLRATYAKNHPGWKPKKKK